MGLWKSNRFMGSLWDSYMSNMHGNIPLDSHRKWWQHISTWCELRKDNLTWKTNYASEIWLHGMSPWGFRFKYDVACAWCEETWQTLSVEDGKALSWFPDGTRFTLTDIPHSLFICSEIDENHAFVRNSEKEVHPRKFFSKSPRMTRHELPQACH